MSGTSSERLMYIQFMSCVQGEGGQNKQGSHVLIYELMSREEVLLKEESSRKYMIYMIYKRNDLQRFECF